MPPRYHSDITDASPLAQPLKFEFSGRTAPNRFLKAAMTERLSSWDVKEPTNRGIPSEGLIRVYRKWGEGGFGHILTGNLMVDYNQLEARGNPIIPLDAPFSGARFEAFKKLAQQAKAQGSLISGQVSHPGRQVASKVNPDPIGASPIQLMSEFMGLKFNRPHAATQDEINHIIHQFTHAAEFLYHAGYDGIQLHAAHGYLLAQFLSKSTNQRDDKYGGSLRNRTRFLLEIAQSIRSKLPKSTGFIIGVKLNSVEFQKDGFEPKEAREVCEILEEAEFDYVELSGGTYESLALVHKRESTRKRESFFLEFAEHIVPGLKKTKVYVTGGFHTVSGMVNALKTVQGVGLGRPICQEFSLPKDMLSGKFTGSISIPVDHNDFSLTEVIAGSQMRQVGKGLEPLEMSKEETVKAFMKDMEIWETKFSSDDPDFYGYADIVHALGDSSPQQRL